MTATDVLRRMLDERGVEWWEATPCKTKWNSPIIGGPVAAREWNGEMVLDTGYIAVTPEQAIAATLGSSNCTNDERTNGACHDMYTDDDEWFACSECNTELRVHEPFGVIGSIRFCPNCGRRVEQ